MSKSSKTRKQLERKKEKMARKEAMKRLYESYRDSGKNSKRAGRRKFGRPTVSDYDHPEGPCGNIGCARCFPQYRRAA